jgi:hypothetical protein
MIFGRKILFGDGAATITASILSGRGEAAILFRLSVLGDMKMNRGQFGEKHVQDPPGRYPKSWRV